MRMKFHIRPILTVDGTAEREDAYLSRGAPLAENEQSLVKILSHTHHKHTHTCTHARTHTRTQNKHYSLLTLPQIFPQNKAWQERF